MDEIPIAWIQRLFARFQAMYGSRMTSMYGDCPAADIHDAWATGLADLSGEELKLGLEACARAHPSWPPTLGEFVALCKAHRQRGPQTRSLPAPRAPMPPDFSRALRSAKEIGKGADPHGWAKAILAEAEAGTYRWAPGIESAKRVLGVTQ